MWCGTGMELIKVGDDLTADLDHAESIDLIKAAGRPLRLSFRKPVASAKGLFGGFAFAGGGKPAAAGAVKPGGIAFGGAAAAAAAPKVGKVKAGAFSFGGGSPKGAFQFGGSPKAGAGFTFKAGGGVAAASPQEGATVRTAYITHYRCCLLHLLPGSKLPPVTYSCFHRAEGGCHENSGRGEGRGGEGEEEGGGQYGGRS